VDVLRIEPSEKVYDVQRRNLYPFLSKKEMEGWMEDKGVLRIRWFGAFIDQQLVGVVAWEVYDIHRYEPNGPKFVILDLYTMEVEKNFRDTSIGKKLFSESLVQTIADLSQGGFIVGALQIETYGATGFYEKVLSSLSYSYETETREIMPGCPITVFWVPLKRL
jgi:hypothetical protein